MQTVAAFGGGCRGETRGISQSGGVGSAGGQDG